MSNAKQIFPEWNKTNIPLLPDIRLINVRGSFIWVLNSNKFSFKSAYNFTAWQKKSSGSILIGLFSTFHDMTNKSGFVPNEMSIKLEDFYRMRKMRSYTIGTSIGYTYTFVYKENWYANATLIPGYGLEFYKAKDFENNTIAISNAQSALQLQIRSAFGWNSDTFYSGIIFVAHKYIIKNEDAPNFSYSLSNLDLFVGYHLKYQKKK